MLNSMVMWVCAHPLEFVASLIVVSGALSIALIPRLHLHELPTKGHPRC